MSSQKHILFISSWYPTKNNPTHGIFNYYFARAVALNNKVSVLHVSSVEGQAIPFVFDVEVKDNITTLQVYYRKVTSRMPFFSQLQKYLRRNKAAELGYEKLVRQTGRPDIVHLNVAMPAGVAVLKLSKKYGLPYVVNENWSGYCEEDGNYKGFVQTYFTRKIIAGAGAILPTSEFLKQAMLSHGLKGNYIVVPNVVDIHRFTPQDRTDKTLTRFVHISSLTDREKNVSGIIRAFVKALEINPAMELNIVGDGDERTQLQQMATKLEKSGKIKFRGRLLGADLVNEMNSADSLVMFSHFETFCLVIIEAFACGRPVVTSNAGAIKSYMKPELGIMVEKRDELQLMQAFLDLAKNKGSFDSGLIRDFAAEHYSYEKVSLQLDDIYNQVLSAGNAGSKFITSANITAT